MRRIIMAIFVATLFIGIVRASALRDARIYSLTDFDLNADGFLEDQDQIRSGDVIYRDYDLTTAVERGYYIVPNNVYFIDQDADGQLDPVVGYARLVIVMRDNLTYLFKPESSELMGVFPNGVGSAGSNSVASIRRINVRLGESWGADYSAKAGYEQNMFGSITLGTAYIIDSDPSHDIDTFQEVHGTPPNLEFLLGREISAGCVRHSNRSIGFISRNVSIGEVVLTVESAQDDQIDNPLNLYNRTRVAAGLRTVTVPFSAEDIGLTLFPRPRNHVALSLDLSDLETATWANFDQIVDPVGYQVAEHPYTRGNYRRIPCGTETVSIAEFLIGRDRLIETTTGRFRLIVAEEIEGLDGSRIKTSDFYDYRDVGFDEISQNIFIYSGGSYHIAYFQYLVWDLAYQYAEYVANRDRSTKLSGIDLQLAVARLSNRQLYEVQYVTGLIPVRYSYLTPGPDGIPGERLAASLNRTIVHRLLNIFYGQPGQVYELNFRQQMSEQAVHLRDIPLTRPSIDHELTAVSGESLFSPLELIETALSNDKGVIFRITAYRRDTMPISTLIGLSANHYYALIPGYTDLESGYIAIQDSMHPYDLLFIPLNEISEIFSTLTISP